MLEQIIILCTGVPAVFLSQSLYPETRRWACVFGRAGQPAWFYAAWTAQQWGLFAICFLYAASWARGFWNYWIKPMRFCRSAM